MQLNANIPNENNDHLDNNQDNNLEDNQDESLDIEIIEIDNTDIDQPIDNNDSESEYIYNNQETEEDQKIQEEKENSRFKDGEKLTMIRVRFPGNARSFPFLVGKRKFAYGQKVVAMSDRGMTVGYINSFPYEIIFNKSMLPVRSIAKVASSEDIKAQIEFRDSEKKAEVICIHLIERHQLDMVLTHVEFTQFGKKAVFYFNAPARVDFRDLVKDLVFDLKMRIELRQISVRDRAAALGSVGACGLQTCCSSFLKNYGNVSIKMAKNQNLALIPTKLNGVCGQIKCCIRYEDDVYSDKRKNLPREGSFIRALNGDKGKVQKLNILIEQFEMLTDNGIRRRYSSNQYKGRESDLGNDYRFPEFFDNIINETQAVIGLSLEDQNKADKFLEHNAVITEERPLENNQNKNRSHK
jgi:cell fate regulator YaaT (PSP1 superfamily)